MQFSLDRGEDFINLLYYPFEIALFVHLLPCPFHRVFVRRNSVRTYPNKFIFNRFNLSYYLGIIREFTIEFNATEAEQLANDEGFLDSALYAPLQSYAGVDSFPSIPLWE